MIPTQPTRRWRRSARCRPIVCWRRRPWRRSCNSTPLSTSSPACSRAGYRLLARIPRLPEAVINSIVARYGSLQKVMRATAEDLEAVRRGGGRHGPRGQGRPGPPGRVQHPRPLQLRLTPLATSAPLATVGGWAQSSPALPGPGGQHRWRRRPLTGGRALVGGDFCPRLAVGETCGGEVWAGAGPGGPVLVHASAVVGGAWRGWDVCGPAVWPLCLADRVGVARVGVGVVGWWGGDFCPRFAVGETCGGEVWAGAGPGRPVLVHASGVVGGAHEAGTFAEPNVNRPTLPTEALRPSPTRASRLDRPPASRLAARPARRPLPGPLGQALPLPRSGSAGRAARSSPSRMNAAIDLLTRSRDAPTRPASSSWVIGSWKSSASPASSSSRLAVRPVTSRNTASARAESVLRSRSASNRTTSHNSWGARRAPPAPRRRGSRAPPSAPGPAPKPNGSPRRTAASRRTGRPAP